MVLDGAVQARDILIESGRIEAVTAPGDGRAKEEIDARGLIVMPGAVDAHAHFNEPGRADWEGWAAGTAGAALGGITTVADMPLNSLPPTLDGASFDQKREAAAAVALVDHALWGGLVAADPRRLRELRERGAVGVKAFLAWSGVEEFPRLTEAALADALREAARAGLVVAVHCEDEAITRAGADSARAEGRRDSAAWLASRPADAEVRAIDRLADAAQATGARVHVVHVSGGAAADAVRRAKARGVWLTAETCPHYLTFTEADVASAGAALKCAPPIRGGDDREALWRALADGALDLIASDHSPCPAEMKRGDDLFAAWGGIVGIQSFMPTLLTETSGARRRGLPWLARLVSEAPARLLGLFPRKGSIRPHSDADLVLIDTAREWTLAQDAVVARSAISPYAGRAFTGQVVRTIVRGVTVQLEGQIVARPGHGRLVTP